VTPEDLQRVACEYLTPENRTLYALLPAGAAPKLSTVAELTIEHPIQLFVMSSGLRLLVKEDHRLPFVQFRVVFKGGVLAESARNNGLTHLTAKLLLKGTRSRSAVDIAKEIESVGGSIDSFAGNNSFGASAEVLSEDFDTGLGLVADVLLEPAFPAAEVERERQLQLANLKSQKDQLLKSAGIAMRRALFGETGYGLDVLGAEASVKKLQVTDLEAFHRKLVVPNNCVVAVYGDVNPAAVHAAVERAFSRWKGVVALAPCRGPTAQGGEACPGNSR